MSITFRKAIVRLFIVFALTSSAALAQEDIRVLKSAPANAIQGNNVAYDVTISNIGASSANGVTLTDTVPAGTTFVSASQFTGPTFNCTTPPGGGTGAITCTIATLANGASATFQFVVNINPSTPPSTVITNTATGVSTPPDSNPGNDSASANTTVLSGGADLAVTKSGPATAPAGSDVSYTVTVTNNGPNPAPTVTLNDPVPSGMTFVSATQNPPGTPAFICDTTVSCTTASLLVGQSASFTFVFNIPGQTPPGTSFNNTASASTSETDPNEENNSTTVTTTTPPPPQANMGITKTGPSTAGPDTDVVYTISVFNAGPDDADSVAWSDTLPGTMTFVSLSQDSGPMMSCTTGGTINCSLATMTAGTTATFTLTGHIPPATPSGTTFTNTATVSTTTQDPSSENDSSVSGLTTSAVDVSITKSGPPTTNAATDTSYTIVVANAGPDTAVNVSWSDPLPPGTTFVSLTQDNGPGAICAQPSPGFSGTVTCTWTTLPASASAQFTLTINSGSAATISNTVNVQSDDFDTNTSNNTSTANTLVTQSADVSVTKVAGAANVTAGNNISYTVTITNSGPSDAANVSLTDNTPANATFISNVQNNGPTFNCINPAVGGSGPITCTIATLTNGTTATFTFTFRANSSATGTVSNTATGASSTTDPNGGNNSQNTSTPVVTSADLSITKTGPPTITAGSNISYTITASNAGPSDAATVTISDAIPTNTTFVSNTQNSGPSFNCTNPAVGASTGTINCTIASFPAGATSVFTFTFNVSPTATGTVTNNVTISSPTPDPTPGNGASGAGAVVNPGPVDLSVTKTANGTSFPQGATVTYTIVATNNGPGISGGTTVTDTIPPGTTLLSVNTTQGSCSGNPTVVCNLGILNPGSSATITLMVQLPMTIGPVSNTATITSANAETAPANNASTAALAVVAPIPTLSELALLAMAAMLAVAAAIALRR